MTTYNYQYAFPVAIEYDADQLIKLFEENKSKGNLATLRLVVSDHPYLQALQTSYSWLGDHVDFFTTYPGIGYPIHIDNTFIDRKVVLNIPLINSAKSYTNWYNIPDTAEWTQSDPSIANKTNEGVYVSTGKFLKAASIVAPLVPLYTLETLEPVVINTKVPHDVKNKSGLIRVIASWHLRFDNYAAAKDILNV